MKNSFTFFIVLTYIFSGCSTQKDNRDNINRNIPVAPATPIHASRLTGAFYCIQTKLSTQFNVDIFLKQYIDSSKQDSSILTIYIKDKATDHTVDTFHIHPLFNISKMFINYNNMTSYSTGYNAGREISDNYFGDIVVADLNFDNRDDVAVINDNGGNGGPLYTFYMQMDSGKFTKDDFLTDSVSYFPTTINKQKKELVTYVHAGACCTGKHIYQYDQKSNRWKQVWHVILGI